MRSSQAIQDHMAQRAVQATMVVFHQLAIVVRETDVNQYSVSVHVIAPCMNSIPKISYDAYADKKRELAKLAKRRALVARADKRRRADRRATRELQAAAPAI